MVMTEKGDRGAIRLILKPNRSLSWQGNKRFMVGISTISLGIAGWFAWLGAWLILPFAGLELMALGFALYWVACQGLNTEIITIDGETVEIQKGRRHLQVAARLQRCWARIRIEPAYHAWYPERLLIGSHGEHIEIGSFLNRLEKNSLARELKQII